ncbi:MAG: hypothetical protein GEU83_03390 [Pseudonocardiaceae bacterium]|nr:hypothetical protein [Pseudonocardiaceae bacterium]
MLSSTDGSSATAVSRSRSLRPSPPPARREVSTQEDNGSRPVLEGGPVALWGHFERAYDWWQALGEPGWERFGLTVTPNTHTVWLDDSNGNTAWTLAM